MEEEHWGCNILGEVDEDAQINRAFVIRVHKIVVPSLTQYSSMVSLDNAILLLRLSLYDVNTEKFVGKTYHFDPCSISKNVNVKQQVIFHSGLKATALMLVVELALKGSPNHKTTLTEKIEQIDTENDVVENETNEENFEEKDLQNQIVESNTKRSSQICLSVGWCMAPCSNKQYSSKAASKKSFNNLLLKHGSPRFLLLNDKSIEELQESLTNTGMVVQMSIHQIKNSISPFVPPHIFVPSFTNIPPFDSTSELSHPHLLPLKSAHVSQLKVAFNMGLKKFEDKLLMLITQDSNKPQININRRILKVGVHNGMRFISALEQISMSCNRSNSFGNNASTAILWKMNRSRDDLIHENKVEIGGVSDGCMIVFGLFYEVSSSVVRGVTHNDVNNKDINSTDNRVEEVLVRWGVLNESTTPGVHKIYFNSGRQANPFKQLVFNSVSNDDSEDSDDENDVGSGGVEGEKGDLNDVNEGSVKLKKQKKKSLSVKSLFERKENEEQQENGSLELTLIIEGEAYIEKGRIADEKLNFERQQLQQERKKLELQMQKMQQQQTPTPWDDMEKEMVQPSAEQPQKQLSTDNEEMNNVLYFPVQVPIMASVSRHRSGAQIFVTRATTTHLNSLPFPPITDHHGNHPSNVELGRTIVPDKEDNEYNIITLQLMALSSTSIQSTLPDFFFSIQFYRFQNITSEILTTEKLDTTQEGAVGTWVVKRKVDDGGGEGEHDKSLGYQISFRTQNNPDLIKYLSKHQLQIFFYNAHSLFPIGSAFLELKCLLRQAKTGVQSDHLLPITNIQNMQSSSVVPMTNDVIMDSSAMVETVGHVHLRAVNMMTEGVAEATSFKSSKPSLFRAIVSRAKRLTDEETGLFEAISRYRSFPAIPSNDHNGADGVNDSIQGSNYERSDNDLRSDRDVRDDGEDNVRDNEEVNDENEMANNRIRSANLYDNTATKINELNRLKLVRSDLKSNFIRTILNDHITQVKYIKVHLGSVSFFEHSFSNPLNNDIVVIISWFDSQLDLVTNSKEWRYYKELYNLHTPMEHNMFLKESKGTNQTQNERFTHKIFLRAKEQVFIPFKFFTLNDIHNDDNRVNYVKSSMLCDEGMCDEENNIETDNKTNDLTDTNYKKNKDHKLQYGLSKEMKDDVMFLRNIRVTFSRQNKANEQDEDAHDNSVLSVLELQVQQQVSIVNEHFSFYHSEQTFFNRSFRLTKWNSESDLITNTTDTWTSKCSDNTVLCNCSPVSSGAVDISLKTSCGLSGEVRRFYVLLYRDVWCARPVLIWHLEIKVTQRVDVTCVQAQTSRFALMLKGGLTPQQATCHSSHPSIMTVHPSHQLTITPASIHQLNVVLRPMKVGISELLINVVDEEEHQLLATWLVHVTTHQPIISRQFELNVQVGGAVVNKKISFTNPYNTYKVFLVSTNREDLLLLKNQRLQLNGHESSHIGMRYLSGSKVTQEQVMVFINDEEGRIEEAFVVIVNYNLKKNNTGGIGGW